MQGGDPVFHQDKYGKKAKISSVRCSPHTLRHAFAKQYLMCGGDVFSLQRILGHSTLEMIRHYAEVADNDVMMRNQMAQLPLNSKATFQILQI